MTLTQSKISVQCVNTVTTLPLIKHNMRGTRSFLAWGVGLASGLISAKSFNPLIPKDVPVQSDRDFVPSLKGYGDSCAFGVIGDWGGDGDQPYTERALAMAQMAESAGTTFKSDIMVLLHSGLYR